MQAQLTYGLSIPSGTDIHLPCQILSHRFSSVLDCLELVLTGNVGVVAQIPQQGPFTCHDSTSLVHI